MLEDTGERIIPEEMNPTNGLLLEHLARYYFSLPYVHGKVLDIACGTGYGTKMIAKMRKKYISSILGVDVDPSATNYANKHYYHPLLSFQTGNALDKSLKDRIGTFDTIISFETIEHVPDDQEFLERVYELLNPGGILVLSTPFGEGRGKTCGSPFHYHQLTESEFIALFNNEATPFDSVSIYYQQGVALERDKRDGVNYPLGVAVCHKPARL